MHPVGTLGLLGLQSQMLFMKDLLDKVKVREGGEGAWLGGWRVPEALLPGTGLLAG
jgi:hypothetical protein